MLIAVEEFRIRTIDKELAQLERAGIESAPDSSSTTRDFFHSCLFDPEVGGWKGGFGRGGVG